MNSIISLTICVVFLTAQMQLTHGCSCAYQPPHQHFCYGGYGIVAKILSKSEEISQRRPYGLKTVESITYRARVLKDLRKFSDAPVNNMVNIKTRGNGGLCGVNLDVMKTYVLAGSYISPENLRIHSCNYYMPVKSSNIEKVEVYDCRCRPENFLLLSGERPKSDRCVVGFNMPECSLEGIRCKSEEGRCNWVCTD